MRAVPSRNGFKVQERKFFVWITVLDGFPTLGDAKSWINLHVEG